MWFEWRLLFVLILIFIVALSATLETWNPVSMLYVMSFFILMFKPNAIAAFDGDVWHRDDNMPKARVMCQWAPTLLGSSSYEKGEVVAPICPVGTGIFVVI